MLIKSTRAQTAAGMRRVANHVFRGAENENITVLRGTEEDVADAFRDARKHGRKFAVRRWVIAPEFPITRQQALQCVDWLAGEFGFFSDSAVVVEHQKPRVNENNNADCHYHVLVGEVDPETGRVLSNSQNYARHEKLSRCAEIFFGHPIISGKHNDAVIAALRREKNDKIADDLEKSFAANPDELPHEAFTSSDHQRTARLGIDLPYLRSAVQEMWQHTDDRPSLEVALSELSLVISAGKRDGVYVVRSVDGTFIGSLARLARVRKSEIAKRMEAPHAQQSYSQQAQAHHRAGNLPEHEGPADAVGAGGGAGGADDGPCPSQSRGRNDFLAGKNRGGAGANQATAGDEPSNARQHGNQAGHEGGYQQLALALGISRHRDALIDLLGRARKAAMEPAERVTAQFDDFIEYYESAQAKAAAGLSEPAALRNARRTASDAMQSVSESRMKLLSAEDAFSTALGMRRPLFSWMTNFAARKQAVEQQAQARVDSCKKQLKDAESASRDAESNKRRLERDYRVAAAEFSQFWQSQAAHSVQRISAAKYAKQLTGGNPQFARWGAEFLFKLSVALMQARLTRADEVGELEAPDYAQTVDIWGVPHHPRPR